MAYVEESNVVDYNVNSYDFSIFKEVYCDNVNDTDRKYFKKYPIKASAYVVPKNGQESNNIGYIGFECVLGSRMTACEPVSVELTDEQYNEFKDLNDDELMNALLPLVRCQGNAEHEWSTIDIGFY